MGVNGDFIPIQAAAQPHRRGQSASGQVKINRKARAAAKLFAKLPQGEISHGCTIRVGFDWNNHVRIGPAMGCFSIPRFFQQP
jgi:hypothetical protein